MRQTLFNEKRTTQAAVFFLFKAGGKLPVIKLMKLLYLAERESYRQYGEPISGDNLVSMPQGPVLSRTLDLMNGASFSASDGWSSWIEGREGYDVGLRDLSTIRTPEEDLKELSDGDLEVLAETWNKYGHIEKFNLVRLTHSGECPEWKDPDGSSHPIPLTRLFESFGFTNDAIHEALEHLEEQRDLIAAQG